MPVRVRYAPSPTGDPHLGNIRTALFNWLFARCEGGKFILRIEDTDQARYVPTALDAILQSLRWLGLDWDEGPEVGGSYGPYFQSERLERYQEAVDRLVEAGCAYRCDCSPERLSEMRKDQQRRKQPPKYDRRCRSAQLGKQLQVAGNHAPVIRFKTPLSGETSCRDLRRRDLVFANDTLDDFVLLKSDGYPTYHLANVVDDHAMQISHILRGDEWLSSAPRHRLLYQALGWEPPSYIHLPMILGPDRAKLSKRHGDTSVLQFRDAGFLPEALFNFLGLLGWSLDDRTEIIDRGTFVKKFTLDRILANPAAFNVDKLEWMNGVYIRALPIGELVKRAAPFLESRVGHSISSDDLLLVAPLIQERLKRMADVADMADFFFIDGDLDYDPALLLGKQFKDDSALAISVLKSVLDAVQSVEVWNEAKLEALLRSLTEELGLKTSSVFGLIRVAISGRTAAPPLFETMEVLGRSRTVSRLEVAFGRLKKGHAS